MIHEEKRLGSGRAHVSPAGRYAGGGEVEDLEQLRQRIAEDGRVDAGAIIRVPVAVVGAQTPGKSGPSQVENQPARRGQKRVSDALGVQPATVGMSEQAVLGIDIARSRIAYGGLPIRA